MTPEGNRNGWTPLMLDRCRFGEPVEAGVYTATNEVYQSTKARCALGPAQGGVEVQGRASLVCLVCLVVV
jgi:hypothetical protein